MIKKKSSQYCVYDSTGQKELGCHSTKAEAQKQLAAIEISKSKLKEIYLEKLDNIYKKIV